MKQVLGDFELQSLSETPLIDVYKANLGGEKGEAPKGE